MPERGHPLAQRPVARHVRQFVRADVQAGQARQRQRRQLRDVHVRQLERAQLLDVVEELLEVGPDGVGAEVEGGEAAQPDEDVVGENC